MPQVRPILPLFLIAIAAVALTSCKDVRAAPDDAHATREAPAPEGELVMLADGTTMVARKGTLSRSVADWLAGDEPTSRMFAFGSVAFVPETARLSPHGLGSAADLGTLLRATPSAQLTLDGAADPLTEARAQTLAHFLGERGILPNQVQVVSEPTAGRINGPKDQNDLSFWLERRKAA